MLAKQACRSLRVKMGITDLSFVAVVAALLLYSAVKDGKKTKQALKISVNALKKQLPIFISVFLLIGVFEAFLTKGTVQVLMGSSMGMFAPLVGTIVGGVAAGPPAAAYPIAQYLWKVGASQAAVAAFVVAWISVGTVTLPMEIATYGRRFALTRWTFSIATSVIIGLIMGALL